MKFQTHSPAESAYRLWLGCSDELCGGGCSPGFLDCQLLCLLMDAKTPGGICSGPRVSVPRASQGKVPRASVSLPSSPGQEGGKCRATHPGTGMKGWSRRHPGSPVVHPEGQLRPGTLVACKVSWLPPRAAFPAIRGTWRTVILIISF